MSRRHAFLQLILARMREFFREPEVLFWVYGFPLILATVLGIAFASSQPTPPVVDVEGAPGDQRAEAVVAILKNAHVTAALESPANSQKRFRKGKTDLIVVPRQRT